MKKPELNKEEREAFRRVLSHCKAHAYTWENDPRGHGKYLGHNLSLAVETALKSLQKHFNVRINPDGACY